MTRLGDCDLALRAVAATGRPREQQPLRRRPDLTFLLPVTVECLELCYHSRTVLHAYRDATWYSDVPIHSPAWSRL